MAERGHKEPADVLVIGSGASGAIASLVLGQAGLDVVCLEQGGWTLPDDHPHMSPDWEWQRQKRWHPNNNLRRGRDDFPVESASSNILMWNAVGGSTNIYTALWPRYRPSDFRKGVEHGLAPDWPISYEDLAPYYDRVDRLVGVSGLAGNPALPPHQGYPTPPLPLRPVGRRLARAFDRLGWHWWPIPAGVVSEDYDGRPACNGCSACAAGCARGSMSKFSLSVWPKALAAGVDLRPFARVERLERGADGRVSGAVYVDRRSGIRRFQAADVVVVACNGVGTPRLLLMSGNLANGSDQVGRNLMHHTLVAGRDVGRGAAALAHGLHRRADRHGVRRDRHQTRLRQRLQLQLRDRGPRRRPVDRLRHAGLGALGRGPPRLVPPPLRPWLCGVRDRRRPAAGEQPRHAVRHGEGRGRLAGAEDRLCAARERPAHDALRARAP